MTPIRSIMTSVKGMQEAGLPHGVLFDIETPKQEYRQYSGASNAQSALIQFIDIVLGVEHNATTENSHQPLNSKASQTSTTTPEMTTNFIHRMRKYMANPHRRFLEDISTMTNTRQYVENHHACPQLRDAYNASLTHLRDFRDAHLRVAITRDVVAMQARGKRQAGMDSLRMSSSAWSCGAGAGSGRRRGAIGTGGTAAMPFLKRVRDETGERMVGLLSRWM